MSTVLGAAEAWAYDFDITSQTVAQAYQLRWTRFSEQNRFLNRRRLTQSLSLDVWNILEPDFVAGRLHPPPLAPFNLTFTLSLRLDHDFGDYTQGDVRYMLGTAPIEEEATTTVPELAGLSFGLDVLYAQVGARGILGVLDVSLGRQILVDNLEWISFDGLAARVKTPWHAAVSAFAGWMVRESSPLAVETHEPDGTASSQCTAFSADTGVFEPVPECRQRERPMPTFGFGVEAVDVPGVSARIAYRRAVSASADIYPNTLGEAPSYGVNEEMLSASARVILLDGGVVPWASARWNFLLGTIDEAYAGVRLGGAEWAVTPEMLYSLPSFDGDSIFNVFSIDPYWEARVTGDAWPERGKLRGYARVAWRRFLSSDEGSLLPGEQVPGPDVISLGVGGRWRERRGTARLDLFFEDGFGGQRIGGDAYGKWRLRGDLELEGRLSVIRFREDLLADLRGTSFGAQAGARWVLGPEIALHLLLEENVNRLDTSQFRVIAVVDLAFSPEH